MAGYSPSVIGDFGDCDIAAAKAIRSQREPLWNDDSNMVASLKRIMRLERIY